MRPLVRGTLAVARTVLVGATVLSCSADGITGPPALEPVSLVPASATALPSLVISELMADPSRVADGSGEWFEVYNGGTEPFNLRGLKIESGVTAVPENHVITADVIVPAGGYVVLANNANSATNGGLVAQYSYGTAIVLNNSNTDWLLLKTTGPDSATIDSVAYAVRTNGTVGSYSVPAGASKAVVDVALDNTVISGNTNWITTPTGTTYGLGDRGTPGTGPGGVIVQPGPVKTVTITPSPATGSVGATRQFSATGKDSLGTTVATTFTWSSSNQAVATISATGLASALSAGTTTITATSAAGPFATATLTVTDPSLPASVSLGFNSPARLPIGFTKPIFVNSVKDGNGTTISPTPRLTWTSAAPGVASVDSLGYVTALGIGSAPIIATTANGVADTVFFTMIEAEGPTSAQYANHLELGTPVDADPSDDIPVAHRGFRASYNALRGGPNWVSWHLNTTHFGSAPRCECFSADGSLPAGVIHVADLDYRSSGYDRGHMVQSDSRSSTLQENAATFFMTNILPQAADNNQGPWLDLENYLDTLAIRDGKEIFIVAGGIWASSPTTLKGAGRVAIPDYTWKVAVVLSHGADLSHVTSLDSLRVIAVKMPNLTTAGVPASAVGIRPRDWETFATTVDAIEAETGYDVLSLLPDRIERPAEANDRAPVAKLSGPANGTEGSAAAFDASASSDPDGDALEYAWSFGDGATASGVSASHTWADNGTYTVTLTVTDPYGADDVITRTVTIANAAPVVSLGAGASGLEILSGDAFDATGAFSDAGTADAPWQWNLAWNDGAPDAGTATDATATIAASHRYLASGSYTVTLSVTDKDGGTGSQAVTVLVRRRPVTVELHPAAINAGNEEGNAKLKLVVLSDGSVDATTVDLASVRVSGTGVSMKGNGQLFAQTEDADGDGDVDLVLRVDRRALVRSGALEGDTPELLLVATLADGREIEGRVAAQVAGR